VEEQILHIARVLVEERRAEIVIDRGLDGPWVLGEAWPRRRLADAGNPRVGFDNDQNVFDLLKRSDSKIALVPDRYGNDDRPETGDLHRPGFAFQCEVSVIK